MRTFIQTYYRLLEPHLVIFDQTQGDVSAALEALEAAARGVPTIDARAWAQGTLWAPFPARTEAVSKLLAALHDGLESTAGARQEAVSVILAALSGHATADTAGARLHTPADVQAYAEAVLKLIAEARAAGVVYTRGIAYGWATGKAGSHKAGAAHTRAGAEVLLLTEAGGHRAGAEHTRGSTWAQLLTEAGSHRAGAAHTRGNAWAVFVKDARPHDATTAHTAGAVRMYLTGAAGGSAAMFILTAGQTAARLDAIGAAHKAATTHGASQTGACAWAEALGAHAAIAEHTAGQAAASLVAVAGAVLKYVGSTDWLDPVQTGSNLYIRQVHSVQQEGCNAVIDSFIEPIQTGSDLYIRQVYNFWQDGSDGSVDTDYYAEPIQTGSNLYIRQDFLGGGELVNRDK